MHSQNERSSFTDKLQEEMQEVEQEMQEVEVQETPIDQAARVMLESFERLKQSREEAVKQIGKIAKVLSLLSQDIEKHIAGNKDVEAKVELLSRYVTEMHEILNH